VREYPLLFVDHKSRLTREGRGANGAWFQANKDQDLGDEKWADVVKINPVDARKYGIRNGQQVRLTTVAGSIVCQAKLWEGVRPGTVAKAFGQGHWAYGRHAAREFGRKPLGGNNNDIIPVDYDRLTGSSVFSGNIGVRIERA
jgi:anaerobic selenocysteine-containing dehydrogenase